MFNQRQTACTVSLLLTITIALLSCTPRATNNDCETSLQSLQAKVLSLQQRVDSLTAAMQQVPSRQTLKTKSGKRAKAIASKKETQATAAYNWQSSGRTTPSYNKTTAQETYHIRTGAICRDGTHSFATGRGACSHHGGVSEWLYE